jgi:hypothetical protein|tara:strand:- start:22926 stop:23432 length:507 start_codon:yes stop_codon:yes gene_type:complete
MTTKASSLFNALDNQVSAPSADVLGGRVRVAMALFDDLATTDLEAADILKICPLPSNARLISIQMSNTDLDGSGSPALDYFLGLYDQDGNALDANVFVDQGTELQAAASNSELLPPVDLDADFGKRVWEQADLTEDPRSFIDLCLTIDTVAATPAAGDIAFTVLYVLD